MKKRALCPLSGVHLTIKPKIENTETKKSKTDRKINTKEINTYTCKHFLYNTFRFSKKEVILHYHSAKNF